jgi:hypothetical protein
MEHRNLAKLFLGAALACAAAAATAGDFKLAIKPMDEKTARDGDLVDKPKCISGATPLVVIIDPKSAAPANLAILEVDAAHWRASFKNPSGGAFERPVKVRLFCSHLE